MVRDEVRKDDTEVKRKWGLGDKRQPGSPRFLVEIDI